MSVLGVDSPETRIEDERVFRWWDYLVFTILSVLSIVALFRFFGAWLSFDWSGNRILQFILTATLVAVFVNQQGRWYLLLPMRRPRPLVPASGLRVVVVTTHVPGSESLQMLERCLDALVALDYPHDTWVLDEGDDEAVREACTRLDVRYFSRKAALHYQERDGPFKAHSKHGNYNAWLRDVGFAEYEVLVAFDPDHVPAPTHLSTVLGFFRDPRIGYVQSAQAYYNQRASFIARGAAEETYAYYSAVEMASYGMEYPIIVGSHNCHRLRALEEVGGFADHDADDLLLTLRYRSRGWLGVYVPRILARGLTPVDWRGYLVQQRRWARSVLDIKLRRWDRYSAGLSARARVMSFLHGANFLHRSLAIFTALLVLSYMIAAGDVPAALSRGLAGPAAALLAVLGASELYRQRFYLDYRAERGLHWRAAVLELAKWPWFLAAVVDVGLQRRFLYTVTGKVGSSRAYLPLFIVHASVGVVLLMALALAWWLRGLELSALAVAGLIGAAGSFALAATAFLPFPPPYDPSIPVWERDATDGA